MNRSSYQLLYPVCATDSNRIWICPCLPLHFLQGTSSPACHAAPISLSSHIIREPSFVVCTNDNLCLITIFFNHISLDTWWSWIPFHFLQSLFVSCLPGWNNFYFLIDSSNFLLHKEHVGILAELLGRPRPYLTSSSVGPMVNATEVLQPSRLIVLTQTPPCLDIPTFAARCHHVPPQRERS